MSKIQVKHLGAISIIASMLFFTGCTRTERALATGAVIGATAAVIIGSYNYPRYRDRPYYYYNDRYYYGGTYRDGYYYYQDRRLYGGRYYPYYPRY
ncbi:MAG: hypothetical protein WC253_05515 [Sulfurovaceae bacterium]|nr:hypothetical protein [Sulfurovaceae bacterium]